MSRTPLDDITYPLSLIDLSAVADSPPNVGGFEVNLDVLQFKSEEISVKTVNDDCIVIEAKHEDAEDEHGFISRHYERRFVLPDGLELSKIQCKISSDGILNVTVPEKEQSQSIERIIPINETNQPFVNPTIPRRDDIKNINVYSSAA